MRVTLSELSTSIRHYQHQSVRLQIKMILAESSAIRSEGMASLHQFITVSMFAVNNYVLFTLIKYLELTR